MKSWLVKITRTRSQNRVTIPVRLFELSSLKNHSHAELILQSDAKIQIGGAYGKEKTDHAANQIGEKPNWLFAAAEGYRSVVGTEKNEPRG